jgi:copper chaperone CopZ
MQKKLLIEGMSCGHCVNHLKTALAEDIKGIKVVDINLDKKHAIVEMEDSVNEIELNSVIEELGFELKGIE